MLGPFFSVVELLNVFSVSIFVLQLKIVTNNKNTESAILIFLILVYFIG
jgi:hypothetical protein